MKKIKKIISSVVFVLLLSVSGNTLLGEASIKANAESLSTYDVMVMEDIEENISTGSEWFDTVSALRQQIVEYQTMRKQTKDEETKDKLDNLIASTQRLVDCCVEQSLDARLLNLARTLFSGKNHS